MGLGLCSFLDNKKLPDLHGSSSVRTIKRKSLGVGGCVARMDNNRT